MKTIFRNVAAVILGIVVGSAVNMTLIIVGFILIPPPQGVDMNDPKSLSAGAHLFGPQHFVFPFLAHALGTLVGAFVAYLIAGSYRSVFAYVIGAFFLVGGIAMCFIMPAPLWYIVLDLAAAYFPMAWLGTQLGSRIIGVPGPLKT